MRREIRIDPKAFSVMEIVNKGSRAAFLRRRDAFQYMYVSLPLFGIPKFAIFTLVSTCMCPVYPTRL